MSMIGCLLVPDTWNKKAALLLPAFVILNNVLQKWVVSQLVTVGWLQQLWVEPASC